MKLFKQLPKAMAIAAVSLAVMVGFTSNAAASFGPARPTKAWSPTVDGFDHVTFNSFTGVGNGIGDERDFLRGEQVGRDGNWIDPVNNVTQNAEVEAKIYIHNNADARLNDAPGNPGIAKNVTVRVAMPTGAKQTQDVTSYISASNAQPATIYDTLTMTGANNGFFQLAYESGTAKVHDQSGHVTTLTSAQEQALLGNGWNMGDQKGCFTYVKEITFKMKVQMPSHTVEKQVAIPASNGDIWKESVDTKRGDTLDWIVTFTNTGKTELKNVKVVDEVPAGLTVVPGSVKVTNGSFPKGYVYPDTAIQANGRQINIDIGNYNPGRIAYVTYRTTVDKSAQQVCSITELVNKAFVTPEGYGAVWDTAKAKVTADNCQQVLASSTTPTSLPKTGASNVAGIFGAASVAGAVAYRWFIGRRQARSL